MAGPHCWSGACAPGQLVRTVRALQADAQQCACLCARREQRNVARPHASGAGRETHGKRVDGEESLRWLAVSLTSVRAGKGRRRKRGVAASYYDGPVPVGHASGCRIDSRRASAHAAPRAVALHELLPRYCAIDDNGPSGPLHSRNRFSNASRCGSISPSLANEHASAKASPAFC